MSGATIQGERYCRGCRYPVVAVNGGSGHSERARCPECGRTFNPLDRRTTLAEPGIDWVGVWQHIARVLAWCVALITAWFVSQSATGGFNLWVWLLGFVLFVPAIFLLTLALIVNGRAGLRLGVIAITSTVLFASVFFSDWPFRVSFAVHRASLQAYIDELNQGVLQPGRIGPTAIAPARVGILRIRAVSQGPDGAIGLHITGSSGGGNVIVRHTPRTRPAWGNTDWERELGGGWYLVSQD